MDPKYVKLEDWIRNLLLIDTVVQSYYMLLHMSSWESTHTHRLLRFPAKKIAGFFFWLWRWFQIFFYVCPAKFGNCYFFRWVATKLPEAGLLFRPLRFSIHGGPAIS